MSDIKVYGTFRNATTSNRVAYAEQVFDEELGKTQAQINQEGSNSNKFRFAHWNVGHFTYYDGIQGDDTPDIPAVDSAAMAIRYKKAINEINADVLGVCEDDPVFDADDTASLPVLYEPRYAICEQGTKFNYMCASLYTNLPLKDVQVSQVYYPQTVQANRYYKLMVATFNGHVVKFVETHLDWNQGDHGAEYRAAQIQKLISDFANDIHVVIAGDFNTIPTSDWDAFTNAGYVMANHGYIGDLITHVNHISQEQYSLDNIIAKGFRISDIKVYESTFELSDHAAIACDLTMINP